jgi:hypothetical protein
MRQGPCIYIIIKSVRINNLLVGWLFRHYQMGDTRVACIGQWLIVTKRGGPWHSFCALKMTKC